MSNQDATSSKHCVTAVTADLLSPSTVGRTSICKDDKSRLTKMQPAEKLCFHCCSVVEGEILFNPVMYSLIQKHHPCTGTLNSKTSGDRKNAFLHCGHVSDSFEQRKAMMLTGASATAQA